MSGLLKNTILLLTLIVAGCADYKSHSETKKHKPFPCTTINIKESYQYDRRGMNSDIKDPSCYITITHTDNTVVRLEFWAGRYRGRDAKVKEIELKKPTTLEFEMIRHNYRTGISYYYASPFYRIECYANIDGELKHITIKNSYADFVGENL